MQDKQENVSFGIQNYQSNSIMSYGPVVKDFHLALNNKTNYNNNNNPLLSLDIKKQSSIVHKSNSPANSHQNQNDQTHQNPKPNHKKSILKQSPVPGEASQKNITFSKLSLKKSVVQPKLPSKKQKLWKYFLQSIILGISIFSSILDIVLLVELINRYDTVGEDLKDYIVLALIVLFIGILYERFQQYKLTNYVKIQTHTQREKRKQFLFSNSKQKSIQPEIPLIEKIFSAIQCLTYTEFVSYFLYEMQTFKFKNKTIPFLISKLIVSCYFKDFLYFVVGSVVCLYDEYSEKEQNILVLILVIISAFQIILVQLAINFKKYIDQNKYNEVNYPQFQSKFPIKLQLYISDPLYIYQHKFNTGLEYKEFKQYLRQKDEQEVVSRPSICETMYLIIYCILNTVGVLSVIPLLHLIGHPNLFEIVFLSSCIISIPPQLFYTDVFFQSKQKFNLLIVIIYLIKMPFVIINNLLQFIFPSVHEIPFLKKVKQFWIYNYLPPAINHLCQLCLQTLIIILIRQILEDDSKYYNENFINTQKLENLKNEDKFIQKYVQWASILYLLNMIQGFFYMVWKIMNNIEKGQQQRKQKIKEREVKALKIQIDQPNTAPLERIIESISESQMSQFQNINDDNNTMHTPGKIKSIFANNSFEQIDKQDIVPSATNYISQSNQNKTMSGLYNISSNTNRTQTNIYHSSDINNSDTFTADISQYQLRQKTISYVQTNTDKSQMDLFQI